MWKRQAVLAVLTCIIYSDVLTSATGTLDIIAKDVNTVVDAILHKSQPVTTASPVPTGSVEIFTAGYPGDSIVVSSSPILLSATVLKAGAPALTNTSLQQDYVPFIVILTGNVIFRANGTVIGNASYTGDPGNMLLLPAYSVVFDTSLLAPGTYSISATYEGPDYPPATYPASIPLTIVPPISKSLSLSLFDNAGTKLLPGTYPATPTDIIYAVLQLDDDSTEAVSEGSMALYLTSANDSSFTSHYFADLASTLEVVPIVDVKEGLAGSFFTISDFPLGLISISGQYMGTGAIATTPVITSAVKLAVTSPSPDPAMSLEAGSVLQAGSPLLPNQIRTVLGRAYYLKLVNAFDNLPVGKALFNTDVTACLINLPSNRANGYTKFLKTSNEFYDFVSTQTSISASTPTVKVTAEASYARLQTSRNDRASYTSLTYTSNNEYSLDLDCISADTGRNYFSTDFLGSLDALPLDITDPSVGSSWNAYETFFLRNGSHYVTSLATGGLINAWATSESSKAYSQSDFAAKVCATAEGRDPLVNKSISGCADVTASSRSASSSFEMNTQVYVRGGSPTTQAALVSSKGAFTDALVEQFFNEAKTSDAPIDYNWAPIYELIQQSFQRDDARYNKGRNLQAYYEGYIAGGCTKDEKNGIVLRRFSKVSGGTLKTYQCERACQGCKNNDDCHSHNGFAFSCYCEGRSCVVANGDYSTIKESPNNSGYEDPENASCQYKPFNCKCNNGDTECAREGKDYLRVGPFYPAQ